MSYNVDTTSDANGFPRFCYLYKPRRRGPAYQSPTLRVKPGDTLKLTLTNNQPPAANGALPIALPPNLVCGSSTYDSTSTNIHFHGTHVRPTCHKDNAAYTLINAGQTFTFNIRFPADHPPGLFWYHPHVFPITMDALLGGASGALIVEGMESVYPAVAGLREQLIIIRDQNIRPQVAENPYVPQQDISMNYVEVPFPEYKPALLTLPANTSVFFRVINTGAITSLNLQLVYDGVLQPMLIVARDGVALPPDSKLVQTTVILSTAQRVEFIAKTPTTEVNYALLSTLAEDTGPDGDNNPNRPIARILVNNSAVNLAAKMLSTTRRPVVPAAIRPTFSRLLARPIARKRTLFFSERPVNASEDPDSDTVFFITLVNQTETAWTMESMVQGPTIVSRQGTVEEWLIENHSLEQHVFHIHQIHFVATERDGVAIPVSHMVYEDTIKVDFWTGTGPYPSVRLRLDFSGPIVGDFLYHCHILEHSDKGMMAKIRVLPRNSRQSYD